MVRGAALQWPALCTVAHLASLSYAMRNEAEQELGISLEGNPTIPFTGKGSSPAYDIDMDATDSRTRECVRSRAGLFPDAYTWFGLPDIAETKQQVEPLLLQLFGVQDQINRHKKNLKDPATGSSTPAGLKAEKEKIKEELGRNGFKYELADRICSSRNFFRTDDTYRCLQARLHSAISPDGSSEVDLQTMLLGHIVAEELGAQEQRADIRRFLIDCRKEAAKILRKAGFSYEISMKECQELMKKRPSHTKLRAQVLKELDVGNTVDEICQEEEGQMCPEGTAPDTQLRIDLQRMATASTATYELGGSLLRLITNGSAALKAGIATGFSAAPATAFTEAAGFLFSIGPKTCACYLRECEFDDTDGVCALSQGTSAASSNPFGRALPYPGTKCGLKWKSTNECEVLQCTGEDYALQHTAAVNGSHFFGKLGYDGDATLYNCLSGTGKPEGGLGLLTTLPTSVSNTAASRNKIFRTLGVLEKKDSQKGPTELPDSDGQEEKPKPSLELKGWQQLVVRGKGVTRKPRNQPRFNGARK